jgi:hypothetical protein
VSSTSRFLRSRGASSPALSGLATCPTAGWGRQHGNGSLPLCASISLLLAPTSVTIILWIMCLESYVQSTDVRFATGIETASQGRPTTFPLPNAQTSDNIKEQLLSFPTSSSAKLPFCLQATFSGDDGPRGSGVVSFQCRLLQSGRTAPGWTPCTSPSTYSNLFWGQYTFQAKAVDAAGNVPTWPAEYNFTIANAGTSGQVRTVVPRNLGTARKKNDYFLELKLQR